MSLLGISSVVPSLTVWPLLARLSPGDGAPLYIYAVMAHSIERLPGRDRAGAPSHSRGSDTDLPPCHSEETPGKAKGALGFSVGKNFYTVPFKGDHKAIADVDHIHVLSFRVGALKSPFEKGD